MLELNANCRFIDYRACFIYVSYFYVTVANYTDCFTRLFVSFMFILPVYTSLTTNEDMVPILYMAQAGIDLGPWKRRLQTDNGCIVTQVPLQTRNVMRRLTNLSVI
jgi:hypothetical protein